jgi:hypothetical protein
MITEWEGHQAAHAAASTEGAFRAEYSGIHGYEKRESRGKLERTRLRSDGTGGGQALTWRWQDGTPKA